MAAACLSDGHADGEKTKITSITEFLERMERLLLLEKEAEYEQNKLLIESRSLNDLCSAGFALRKLRLLDRYIGMGGRRMLKFGYADGLSEEGRTPLPNNKISPGDTVNLCASSDHKHPLLSGVVAKVFEHSITIAFDDDSRMDCADNTSSLSALEFANRTFVVVQSVNDVTYRRLAATLTALKDYKTYQGWILVEYFFGLRRMRGLHQTSASPDLETTEDAAGDCSLLTGDIDAKGASESGNHEAVDEFSPTTYYNKNLNLPQREAVTFCLDDLHPIAVVHGPPGTGKTTVMVEIIRQLIRKQKKVLTCAPSNVAVDNLLEKLVESCSSDEKESAQFVRLGHPARTHSSLQMYSLDVILKRKEYSEVLDDIRREIETVQNGRGPGRSSKRKHLRAELIQRERAAVSSVLRNAKVICCTLSSVTRDGPLGNILNDKDATASSSFGRKFDCAVIDECGQATELSCWSALLAVSGEKCILAGDHCQLPPTVLSEEAAKGGFDRSLMARAAEELGGDFVKMLTVQYRMNDQIMRWPSDSMYHGRLEAGEGVQRRLLRDIPNVEATEETEAALWLIDTADCNMPEMVSSDDESKANVGEVRLVYLHVHRLLEAGVPQRSIAIVSPYNMQVQLLRTYISGVYRDVDVRTIDGFQGQERDAVVLSLVRSNVKREVGFLAERRRMNVAVTRPKRHLAIICDCSTVSANPFLKSLVDYMAESGEVKTALEYEDDYHLIPFSIELDGTPKSNCATPSKNEKSAKKDKQERKRNERRKKTK